MSLLCLWSAAWQTGEASPSDLLPVLLEEAPRVAVEARGVVWVDGRGMAAERLAERLLERLGEHGAGKVRGGLATVPVAAEAAARSGDRRLTVVEEGEESCFLSPLPLTLLSDDEWLLSLLEGAGIRTCGALARLTGEAVEVRFGGEGSRLWRRARADDPRLLFRPIPPEHPHASVDFVDYAIRDAGRLVFTLNALLEQVCGILHERAVRAREIVLIFALAGGGSLREVLRTTRPTADRAFWVRRLRAALERIRPGDAIVGVAVEAGSAEGVSALQGDIFDRGFATAAFVEEAAARLLDAHPGLFVRQSADAHPLAERRVRWAEVAPREVTEGGGKEEAALRSRSLSLAAGRRGGGGNGEPAPPAPAPPALVLHLLPAPRPIRVRTRARRGHAVPISLDDGSGWLGVEAAGPDRRSGGHEEDMPWAREYFRCLSDDGALLWIYRDGLEGHWYLHGRWD